MRLVLDAGALLALEHNDRPMWRRLKVALQAEDAVVTHGGVIGQVWRGSGPRQALLAKALSVVEVHPLDEAAGKAAGELIAATRGRDVIDAAVVLLAADGDQLVTSDVDDLEPLARAAGIHLELVSA
jgi:hypothetical protein